MASIAESGKNLQSQKTSKVSRRPKFNVNQVLLINIIFDVFKFMNSKKEGQVDMSNNSLNARQQRYRSEVYAINAILKKAEQEQFLQFMAEMEQSHNSEFCSYSECDSDDSAKLPIVNSLKPHEREKHTMRSKDRSKIASI